MPNPTDGFFSQRTVLGGVSFVFNFRYNARMDRWILDTMDANSNPILMGQVLQGNWPVLMRFFGIYPGLPGGVFAAVDMTGQGLDPTELTFGGDCQLAFYGPQ